VTRGSFSGPPYEIGRPAGLVVCGRAQADPRVTRRAREGLVSVSDWQRIGTVTTLADAVLPLIRTRADLSRWSASSAHGRQMHEAVNDSTRWIPLIILLLIMLAISLILLRWAHRQGWW
jgi:hypothetical protein